MGYIALGDLISKAQVEKCGKREYPVLSMTMHDGIVFQNDRFKKDIASIDRSNYSVVGFNQLVVSFPIDEGVLAVQDITDAGIVSPAYKIWDIDQAKLVPKYLEMWLRSPRSIDYYKAKLRGTTARRRSIPEEDFLGMRVNVLPMEEQERIVDLITRVNGVILLRKQQLSALDDLIKARFVEMFGTFPSNEKGWPTGTIRDLVTEVRYGSSRKAAEGDSGKYPYLRMNNITYSGELDLSDTKTIDIPDEELDKCTVRRGDLLFNRTNSKELVGKTCVYNRDELMVLAGFVVRVRLNEKALPEFVSAFMNTTFSKQMLLGMCKAAIGQANINAQELQNIGIYIPPIELQREFVSFKEQIDKSKFTTSEVSWR